MGKTWPMLAALNAIERKRRKTKSIMKEVPYREMVCCHYLGNVRNYCFAIRPRAL